MKLDRNLHPTGEGKYALLLIRKLNALAQEYGQGLPDDVNRAIQTLKRNGLLDYGNSDDTDFFVIRLKDKHAYPALKAYSLSAAGDESEWAREILDLAEKALRHPHKQSPN